MVFSLDMKVEYIRVESKRGQLLRHKWRQRIKVGSKKGHLSRQKMLTKSYVGQYKFGKSALQNFEPKYSNNSSVDHYIFDLHT